MKEQQSHAELRDRAIKIISPKMDVNEFFSLCESKAKFTMLSFSQVVECAIDSYLIYGELPLWLFRKY